MGRSQSNPQSWAVHKGGGGGITTLEPLSMAMSMSGAPSGPHGSGKFGYETAGVQDASLQDTIRGSRGSPAYDGKAQRINVHLLGWAGGEKVKCALYDATTKALVGETEERTTGGGSGYYAFAFTVPPNIYAATNYLIACFSGDVVSTRLNSAESTGIWQGSVSYPTWPDPLNPSNGVFVMACWCEYDY